MKRLNWFKNFGLTSAVALATVPAVLTSVSCSASSCYVDTFDFKTVVSSDFECSKIKHYSTSFNNLLYGSMSNHNGNYILIVGSNTNDSVCSWFCQPSIRGRDQWYDDANFFLSPFYLAMLKVTDTDEYKQSNLKDFGVYTYIDFCDFIFKDKTGHEIRICPKKSDEFDQIIKPFDVWDETKINNTYNYNKNVLGYTWDKDSVKKDEYIRNDDYAVAYRNLCKRGLSLFPKTDKRKESFETGNNSDAPRMLIFKAGKLVSIGNIPSSDESGRNAFVKNITDNYKINEEKKQ